MDRVPLNQNQDTLKEDPVVDSGPTKDYLDKDSLDYNRVADYFDLDPADRKATDVKEKVNTLYKWAQEKAATPDRIMAWSAIRHLKSALGMDLLSGKKLVEKLHKFVTLDEQRKKIEKEIDLI